MKQGYMVLEAGNVPLGRLEFDLYDDVVPRTVENFCQLLQENETGKGFRHSTFHRIIRGFMAQGGDFTKGDGTGGRSIYGETFADENFQLSHTQRGTLSMANAGKDTNGSQFFITFRATPHLDHKHVVFGRLNLSTSETTLKKLEGVKTGREDRPLSEITIVECGVLQNKQNEEEVAKQAEDENEIDLDASEEKKVEDSAEIELPEEEEEEEEEEPPKTKAEEIRRRMRKLKMKMNQARQLNKQEVLKEGERLGSVEGAAKARKRQMMQDKKLQEAEWQARNAKALEVAKGHGIDGKHLVEQADASLKKAYKKEEKAKANRFEMHDYHNPEGQHRVYERNLKSLSRIDTEAAASADTYNPLMDTSVDEAKERNGARLLAHEMKRRMDKAAKKKRERMDFEETDVSYINKRNKKFNEKINRTYDKHTAEIRQNLERGTAL